MVSDAMQALVDQFSTDVNTLIKAEGHIEPDMVYGCAEGLYEAFAIALDDALLSPAARFLFDTAERVSLPSNDITYDHPKASQNRLAYVMMLDAVLVSPDAVMATIKRIRDDLVAGDPKLALVK